MFSKALAFFAIFQYASATLSLQSFIFDFPLNSYSVLVQHNNQKRSGMPTYMERTASNHIILLADDYFITLVKPGRDCLAPLKVNFLFLF